MQLVKRWVSDYFKTAEEKDRTDELMEQYMSAIQKKDDLIQKLFATEEQLWVLQYFVTFLFLDHALFCTIRGKYVLMQSALDKRMSSASNR